MTTISMKKDLDRWDLFCGFYGITLGICMQELSTYAGEKFPFLTGLCFVILGTSAMMMLRSPKAGRRI